MLHGLSIRINKVSFMYACMYLCTYTYMFIFDRYISIFSTYMLIQYIELRKIFLLLVKSMNIDLFKRATIYHHPPIHRILELYSNNE